MNKIMSFIISDRSSRNNKKGLESPKNQENSKKVLTDDEKKSIIIELMHDLKTPIISTIGFLQLLESNNQEIRKNLEYENINRVLRTQSDNSLSSGESTNSRDLLATPTLDIINENQEFISEALSNLEKQIKKLSQIANSADTCRYPSQNPHKKIPLKEIVEDSFKLLKPLAIQNRIDIQIQIPEEHHINFEKQKDFQKIMTHLVENGIKYNCYGGLVEISSEIILDQNTNQKQIVIDVLDTGIGFSKEDLRKINSKYLENQLKKEIEVSENSGFGVGLSIVKKLVNSLDGTMIINSQKNRGTTIKLFFPYEN